MEPPIELLIIEREDFFQKTAKSTKMKSKRGSPEAIRYDRMWLYLKLTKEERRATSLQIHPRNQQKADGYQLLVLEVGAKA